MVKLVQSVVSADPGLSHGGGAWDHLWCGLRLLTGCGKPSLSFAIGPKLQDAASKPFKRFKPLKTCQTGSWNCETTDSGKPSGSCSGAKLAAVASQGFLFYWPETGSCSCQTRGCGKPSLSFAIGPKLPDAASKPFKCFKPLKTCQTGSWNCETTDSGKPSVSFSGAKLAAVASQGFLFLLARNCRMLPSKASKASNASNPRNVPNRLLELRNDGLWQANPVLVPN